MELEQLTDVELKEKIKKTDFLKERVIHDSKQITDPTQLKAGREFRRMRSAVKTGEEVLIRILEDYKIGQTRIKARFSRSRKGNPDIVYEGDLYLTDCGIIPYQTGEWNPREYIIPAGEETR